jgi:hypothetical protein
MTLIKYIALAASLFCVTADAQRARFSIDRYKQEKGQDALMCKWSFNQGAALDLSTHTFPLTENGSITYSGRSAILDAAGDYFTFEEYGGTVTFFQTPYYIYGDAFTVSGWCTWTDNTKHTGLFEFYRAGNIDFGIFNYYTTGTSAHAHPVYRARDSSATVYDTLQHHAATWDGGDLKLYINGELVATTTSASTPYFLSSAYAPTIQSDIGKVHSYSGYVNLTGHLLYYSRGLSATEVMKQYQKGPQ